MNISNLPLSTESSKINEKEPDVTASGHKGARRAIIIGAGPTGLTAAYELLKRTEIVPIVLEKYHSVGGMSKTVNYRGNLIDIGGHRFFSGSERVMKWWFSIVSSKNDGGSIESAINDGIDNLGKDGYNWMMLNRRLSRFYFMHRFFEYPIMMTFRTLAQFGVIKAVRIYFSYLKAQLRPRFPENNFEDFLINKYGFKFYSYFFKDYAEKLWGDPCSNISVEFGQRIIDEISCDHFFYPQMGPGQLWEEVARQIRKMGGEILTCYDLKHILIKDNNFVSGVSAMNIDSGEVRTFEGDYVFSTIPVRELIDSMTSSVPEKVREVTNGLRYNDLIVVAVLLKRMAMHDVRTGEWRPLILEDLSICIQEKKVKVGRLQIFNNWSSSMVSDISTVWLGMQFLCRKDSELWQLNDDQIKNSAIQELENLGLAASPNILDATVVRYENAYPVCGGTYDRFGEVSEYTDRFENLFLIGKNSMHKNNSSDQSILTAMISIDNISAGITDKENMRTAATTQNSNSRSQDGSINGKDVSLKEYIFKCPENKWFIRLAIPLIIFQFMVFKFLYPFAGFINGDSYVYLETAYHNFFINTYPIGYSKFLRLISVFTRSDTAVVGLQYLLLQVSTLSLVFTLFYFYRPAKVTRILLFTFMIINPVYLYLSNYISSDAFFLSLSLIWFTLLIWIMNRPNKWMIFVNAVILFVAFTVRYNALFYPVISVVALLLTRRRIFMNLLGFCVSIILIGIFMLLTTNKYVETSGHRQFTPFTGWQMANNALYAYRYIDSAHRRTVPPRLQQLDQMVRNYFDSSRDVRTHPTEALMASTVYMWDPKSPLSIYMEREFKNDSSATALKKWATVAPIMKEYGTFLIKTYPNEFATFYLIPNALKYYAPPVEFLNQYSTGVDSVNETAKVWFEYKSNKIKCYFKDFKVTVLDFYPILTGTMNVVLVFSLISFVLLQGYKKYRELKKGLILLMVLWATNFGFSVFASPIALRFQLFPILISLSFTFLLVDYLVKAAKGEEAEDDTISKNDVVKDTEHVAAL